MPIVGKDIESTRLSIYNASVQAKHPLLGLRFKNTTGAHLNQGPITVFEGNTYAGDTQVLNVQPNEERLLSYAIDLGTEVDPKAGAGAQKITSVKAVKGIVTTVTKITDEKTYRIVNRSQTDRTLLIEHPNRTTQQFKLVDTDKPVEDTPDVYRFQTPVKAGETKSFTVKEERDVTTTIELTNGAREPASLCRQHGRSGHRSEAPLARGDQSQARWDAQGRAGPSERRSATAQRGSGSHSGRTCAETPKEADVYATYLKKLSDQEKEIDALTAKQKKLMTDEFTALSRSTMTPSPTSPIDPIYRPGSDLSCDVTSRGTIISRGSFSDHQRRPSRCSSSRI